MQGQGAENSNYFLCITDVVYMIESMKLKASISDSASVEIASCALHSLMIIVKAWACTMKEH